MSIDGKGSAENPLTIWIGLIYRANIPSILEHCSKLIPEDTLAITSARLFPDFDQKSTVLTTRSMPANPVTRDSLLMPLGGNDSYLSASMEFQYHHFIPMIKGRPISLTEHDIVYHPGKIRRDECYFC